MHIYTVVHSIMGYSLPVVLERRHCHIFSVTFTYFRFDVVDAALH